MWVQTASSQKYVPTSWDSPKMAQTFLDFWRNLKIEKKTQPLGHQLSKINLFFPFGPPPKKRCSKLIPANIGIYYPVLIINSLIDSLPQKSSKITSVNPAPSRAPPASVDVSNPEAPGRKKPRRLDQFQREVQAGNQLSNEKNLGSFGD